MRMNVQPAFRMATLFALLLGACSAASAELSIDRATLAHLASLDNGQTQVIDGFPAGPGATASIRFRRVQVYSNDAHIYVVTPAGQTEVPRSGHVFLRGYSDDRTVKVAMSLNPDGSFAGGTGSGPTGSFALRALTDASGAQRLSALALKDSLPPGYKYEYRCSNDEALATSATPLDVMLKNLGAPSAPAAVASAPSPYTLAIVAIDTDSLFMSTLFSNNTSNAASWIATMFNTMNTMYETDLDVELVQGTTFLRVGTDPYGSANHVPVDTADIDVLATYWRANYAGVKRAFTTLLSGRGPCESCGMNCISCSASGRAWINQYCQSGVDSQGHVVGSYSVEQVFSSLLVDPDADIAARLVGHELGHNFGANHTHCTDKISGLAPVATNTIDQCYNAEAGQGCYGGSTTPCPAGGSGTIMSYCNLGACANDNLLQFNDTQISTTLAPKIAAATPACLLTDRIFANGFN